MAAARKQIWCDVCGVPLPSVALLPTHNKGKKHQRLLNLKQERENSCRKSIYVRGFQNSGSVEEELTEYFNVYGKVSNIFLDKDKGVFAIVEFADEESVSTILHLESLPLLNDKQLIVKERTVNKACLQIKTARPEKSKPTDHSRQHLHGQWQTKEIAEFVPEELVNKLKSSVYTVQQHVNLLMEQLCLTEEDVKLRRLVCQLLQEVFHEVYPGASVVPFGSTVSRVGWKGSDLDVCLLTNENAASSQCDDAGVDYSLVIDVLRSFAPGCVNIVPVLTAKCPLIKFKHQPSGLPCDLSVNNRLGVANSNLLHCYMSLDPRVPQLVFIVRAWAKAKGLTLGRQLSNYALTLMVLYFLQVQTPPVIPSLQQGIDAWINERSDLHSDCDCDEPSHVQFESEVIDNWDCSFFKHTSRLSPSQNTKSLSQLLEEFFFFSTEFDFSSCVVSIRTGHRTSITSVLDELNGTKSLETDANTRLYSNKHLTCGEEELTRAGCSTSELNSLSMEAIKPHETQPGCSRSSSDSSTSLKHGKLVEFKASPLNVQDPFELVHNLTQNVPASMLKRIVDSMKDAHKICSNLNSCCENPKNNTTTLLDLLTVGRTAKKRKSTNCHSFFVDYQEISDVVCAGKLTTTRSIFLFIVETLQKEFGFKCEGKCVAKRQRIETQDSEPLQATNVGKEPQVPQHVTDTQGCDTDARNDHGAKGNQDEVSKPDNIDEVEDNFSAICTAFENTWTHCRRERRKSLQMPKQTNESSAGVEKDMSTDKSQEMSVETYQAQVGKSLSSDSSHKESEANAVVESIASPILIFELKVNSSSQKDSMHGCTVSMEHIESQESQLFGNFFSAYKKYFVGLIMK